MPLVFMTTTKSVPVALRTRSAYGCRTARRIRVVERVQHGGGGGDRERDVEASGRGHRPGCPAARRTRPGPCRPRRRPARRAAATRASAVRRYVREPGPSPHSPRSRPRRCAGAVTAVTNFTNTTVSGVTRGPHTEDATPHRPGGLMSSNATAPGPQGPHALPLPRRHRRRHRREPRSASLRRTSRSSSSRSARASSTSSR